jgi:hypothetical protein
MVALDHSSLCVGGRISVCEPAAEMGKRGGGRLMGAVYCKDNAMDEGSNG